MKVFTQEELDELTSAANNSFKGLNPFQRKQKAVCKSKHKYTSTESAEKASEVLGREYNTSFTVYTCSVKGKKHWHLTTVK